MNNKKLITIVLSFFMCFALSFSAFEIFTKDINLNVEEITEDEENVAEAVTGNWNDYASVPENDGTNYYITMPSELAWIAKNASSTSGKTFIIKNQINLGAHKWYFTDTFYGTIKGDGQIQKIVGLTINYDDSTSDYAGLFGRAEGATIQDIYVEGSINYKTSKASTYAYVGGIVGFAQNTTIQNVISNVSIDYKNGSKYEVGASQSVSVSCYVGGIVGRLYNSSVSKAIVFNKLKANLSISTEIGGWWLWEGSFSIISGIGGVCGVAHSTEDRIIVSDCCSYIDINSNFLSNGGIVGLIGDLNFSSKVVCYTIERCVYGGSLTVTFTSDESGVEKNTGGIVGYLIFANLNIKCCISYMSMGTENISQNITYKSVCGSPLLGSVTASYCYGFYSLSGSVWGEFATEYEANRIGVTTIEATTKVGAGGLKKLKDNDFFGGGWKFSNDPTSQTGWFIPRQTERYKNIIYDKYKDAESTTMGRFVNLPCLNLFYFCCEVNTKHEGNNDVENITMKADEITLSFSYKDCLGSAESVAGTINNLNSSAYGAKDDVTKINKESVFRFCVPITTTQINLKIIKENTKTFYYNEGDLVIDKGSYNSQFVKIEYQKSTGKTSASLSSLVDPKNPDNSDITLINTDFNTNKINNFTFVFDYKNTNFTLYTYHIDAETIKNQRKKVEGEYDGIFENKGKEDVSIDFSDKKIITKYLNKFKNNKVDFTPNCSSEILKTAALEINGNINATSAGKASFENTSFKMEKDENGNDKVITFYYSLPYGYEFLGIYYRDKSSTSTKYNYQELITKNNTKNNANATLSTGLFYNIYDNKIVLNGNSNDRLNLLYGLNSNENEYNNKMAIDGSVEFYMVIAPKLIKIGDGPDAKDPNTDKTNNNFFKILKEGLSKTGNFILYEDKSITDLKSITSVNEKIWKNFINDYKNSIENDKNDIYYKVSVNDNSINYAVPYVYYGTKIEVSDETRNEAGYSLWGIKLFYGKNCSYEIDGKITGNSFYIDENIFKYVDADGNEKFENNDYSLKIYLVYKVNSYRVKNYVFSNSSEEDIYKNSTDGGNAGGSSSSWWENGSTEEVIYYYNQPIKIVSSDTEINSNAKDNDHTIYIVYEANKGYTFKQAFIVGVDNIEAFTFETQNEIKIDTTATTIQQINGTGNLELSNANSFSLIIAFSVSEYEIEINVIEKNGKNVYDSSKSINDINNIKNGFKIMINQMKMASYYEDPKNLDKYFKIEKQTNKKQTNDEQTNDEQQNVKNEEESQSTLKYNILYWNQYQLGATAADYNTGGSDHAILYGAEITLCIRLNSGYNFLGWYKYIKDGNGNYEKQELISTDPYYVFRQGETELKLYALFEENYLNTSVLNKASESNTNSETRTSNIINIDSKNDFIDFANEMKKGNDFEGKIISLNTSIDFSGENFEPLGVKYSTNTTYANKKYESLQFKIEYTPFKGIFNGNGNTLSNINSTNYFNPFDGVFGVIDGGAVYNLNVVNSNFAYRQVYYDNFSVDEITYNRYCNLIRENDNEYCFSYVKKDENNKEESSEGENKFEGYGAIAGYVNDGQIFGCYIKDVAFSQEINLTKIVVEKTNTEPNDGQQQVSQQNEVALDIIEKAIIIMPNNVGGIVGYSDNICIKKCFTDATVAGKNNIGGFIGYENTCASISECYVSGTVGDSYSDRNTTKALIGKINNSSQAEDKYIIENVDIEVNVSYSVEEENTNQASSEQGNVVQTSSNEEDVQNNSNIDIIVYTVDDIKGTCSNLKYSINVNNTSYSNSKDEDLSKALAENVLWKEYNGNYVLVYFYWYVFA